MEHPELIIEAGRAEKQYWKDLWRYRELFYFLAWRDILIRYKQTVVGVAWALVRPLATMLIFTFIFGRVAKLDATTSAPYPIFVLAGLLPWQFFSMALSESGNSLVTNANLISKIYFPRLVVPATTIVTSFFDFLISASLMAVMMIYYRYLPPIQILLLPLFLILALASSMAVGLWLAALTVKYRDFRFIIPFIVQFGVYISPVGFPSAVAVAKIPENLRFLYPLNPVVGVIDGFRWCLLGGDNQIHVNSLILSACTTTFLLVTGIWYFRRTERTFADII